MAGLPDSIQSLQDISGRYAAVLCDVWGVVHNGEWSFAPAIAALQAARARGVAVVLITNSPRPHDGVAAQLLSLGVPRDAWDAMVTSGDVTRELIREAPRKLFHLGPDRELTIYDGLDVDLVEEFEASAVVCTGLVNDEVETPDDYADLLRRLRQRDLPFICANPDIVVERGERLIFCAGALARDYAQLGGRTQIAGKPHAPIYAAALKAAGAVLGRDIARSEALCIGDGMLTDIKGASDAGIDALYISGGIHARDYGDPDSPETELLNAFLGKHGFEPVAFMPKLR